MPFAERKYRRFNRNYPVCVTMQSGGVPTEIRAMSRNVSLGGLLLDTPFTIPEHSQVTFVMTIQNGSEGRPVEIAGEGSVVRVEGSSGSDVRVAIECKAPMAQIENELSEASREYRG